MKLHFEPLKPLAAVASGVDISKPLSPAEVRGIEGGMDQDRKSVV